MGRKLTFSLERNSIGDYLFWFNYSIYIWDSSAYEIWRIAKAFGAVESLRVGDKLLGFAVRSH